MGVYNSTSSSKQFKSTYSLRDSLETSKTPTLEAQNSTVLTTNNTDLTNPYNAKTQSPSNAGNETNQRNKKPPKTLSKPLEAGNLFPNIISNSVKRAPIHPSQDSRPPSIVQLIDDAQSESNFCIDDTQEPLENVAKNIIESSKNEEEKGSKRFWALPPFGNTASASVNNDGFGVQSNDVPGESIDFEIYKRQTAAKVLAERKIERRRQRHIRRQLKALRQEQYFGNYFREQNPVLEDATSIDLANVSYAIDHFNGHRQTRVSHGTHRRFSECNHTHTNAISSSASFRTNQTEHIDDMSSDNDLSSDSRSHVNFDDNIGFTNSSSYLSDSEDSLASSRGGGGRSLAYRYPRKGLKRKLYSRHLTSIGAVSAVSISSMLMLGHSLFEAGPLGTLLGYLISGALVYSVILGYGEMVSLIPLHTGVPGTISRFINPSMGYSIGFCYWLSNAIALPTELTAAATMITSYVELAEQGAITVWIIYIFFLVLLINMCSVRIYGELQFMVNLSRLGLIFFLIIMLCVGNAQKNIGFRYWDSSKSNTSQGWFYGPFRPLFPVKIVYRDDSADQFSGMVMISGISGATGRFLQVWQSVITASRAYINVPIVYASVGEARNPRKSLARATRYIFWQILFFYILSVFILGINIYAGDTILMGLRSINPTESIRQTIKNTTQSYYLSNQTFNQRCEYLQRLTSVEYNIGLNPSPWMIALQSVGQCALSSGINAAFVIFGIATGSSHLYAASRTLYGLMRMRIEELGIRQPSWWNICGWCNGWGVPSTAVMVSFPFALLALMTIGDTSYTVFQKLLMVSSSASLIVWCAMAVAFIRFYYAISYRNKSSKFSRYNNNSENANSDMLFRDDLAYPLKSPFQPYLAWFGLIGCLLILITQGFILFLNSNWDTSLFFASYTSPFLFCIVYLGHWITTKHPTPAIRNIDLDSGRKELERAEWVEDRKYSPNNFSNIWRWILGRFGFVKIFLQTIRGDQDSEHNVRINDSQESFEDNTSVIR